MSSSFSIAILNGTSFNINNPEDLRLHGINPKPQIRDGEKEEEEEELVHGVRPRASTGGSLAVNRH